MDRGREGEEREMEEMEGMGCRWISALTNPCEGSCIGECSMWCRGGLLSIECMCCRGRGVPFPATAPDHCLMYYACAACAQDPRRERQGEEGEQGGKQGSRMQWTWLD